MLPPGLNRAISDSTSPFGAYPSAEVLRKLEVYLTDSRSTDVVYEGLLKRACGQPISVPLLEKVVALLKAYLLTYPPSPDVVQLLEDFALAAQEVQGLSASGQKAVQYVRSCLRQLLAGRPPRARSFRASSQASLTVAGSSSTNSLRNLVLMGRSRDDLTRLAQDAQQPSGKMGVSSGAVSRNNVDRLAASDSVAPATDQDAAAAAGSNGAAGAATLPAFLRMSDGKGCRSWEDVSVPSGSQAGIEPSWTVPARPAQLPPPPPGVSALRARSWMQHLPDLAPRVTLAGSLGATAGSNPATPTAPPLSISGAPLISLASIHRCVLDLEDQEIGRHLAEVLGEARAEAEQLQPTTSQTRSQTTRIHGRGGAAGNGVGAAGRDGGKAGRRNRPARLLFHHPPYNRAEQLPMTEVDVTVVVEAVCGVRAANALSALQGPPTAAAQLEDLAAAVVAGQAEGMWQAAFEEDGDFAQMCGSILMKLIVDMWMRCEPVGSYMLVLRMLRNALRSDQPATRARAFDVVYNLSLHGAMLRGEAEEAALAAAAGDLGNGVAGARGVQMPWQVCASAPVSPFMSAGGGGATPPPAPRPTAPGVATPSAAAPAGHPPAATTRAGGGAAAGAARHVASHSLGLGGSATLDSGGSLTGMASGRGTLKEGGAGGGAGADGARKEGPPEASRPPPPAPMAAPTVKVPTLGGGGGAAGGATGGSVGEGGGATGYERWLRALLFQLLCDLVESREYSEEVWRAAMGCVAQLCSHGGYWVGAWVEHLPPAALSGLLRAASNLNWSQELYAHLLQLVPHVLIRPAAALPQSSSSPFGAAAATPRGGVGEGRQSAFAAPAAVGSAAAAAGEDVAALSAAPDATDLFERLTAFGGLEEVIFHFMRAPTPDSRAALLTALAYGATGTSCDDTGGLGLGSSVSSSGERLPSGRSPRTSSSPGNRAQEVAAGGPAATLAALQGLHLDSVCVVLRAALQRPWPKMSSRLADILASGCTILDLPGSAFHASSSSPAVSVGGSADYGTHTLPAGVASPIAVRALLRPLLESLECSCGDIVSVPQTGELRAHVDISIAHILAAAGAAAGFPTPLPLLTAGGVTAAWAAFKYTCSEGNAEARQLSVHWLHQLLSAACRACHGQIPLLSPLSLKSSQDASKPATASAAHHNATPAAAALGSGGGGSQLPQWNAALADALLHVVREAPLGCELLMAAISRVAADQKALVSWSPDAPPSPRHGALGLGLGLGLAPPHAAAMAHGAHHGVLPGVVAGEEPALAACRRVMWLYYVGLQWMLQCGSSDSRMPAVVELADTVLAALLQPDPAVVHAVTTTWNVAAAAATDKVVAAGSGGSVRGVPGGPTDATSSGMLSQHPSQQQQPAASAAAAQRVTAVAAAGQEPGGGMLISQQLLAGLLALDPDALACTPPELLVTLLQQCSMSLQDAGAGLTTAAAASSVKGNGGAGGETGVGDRGGGSGGEGSEVGAAGLRSMHRGFTGRPCAVAGAQAVGPGGSSNSSTGGCGPARPEAASVRLSAASVGVTGGGGESVLCGAAVGPWQDDWQDRRLALLLLLMARCSLDAEAFAKYSLSHVIKAQLGCEDLRCRYYAGVYLLKHWVLNQQDKYWRTLRHIIGTAQQLNDERLLDNPYLQMRTMLNVDHA